MPDYLHQPSTQVIHLIEGEWPNWDNEPIFPVGKRSKFSVRSPASLPYGFLRPNFRYLFKRSDNRYKWQYWMEVFAYRFGCLIGVSVPPAFVALDQNGDVGALIEWFYPESNDSHLFTFTPGGDLMLAANPDYDRKKGVDVGRCHNLDDVMSILNSHGVENWEEDLFRMLIFDALIGNSDRHHDNWGLLDEMEITMPSGGAEQSNGAARKTLAPTRLSPAFDNGTSLGCERLEDLLPELIASDDWFLAHATGRKAGHHMRLCRTDEQRAPYFGLLASMLRRFPHLLPIGQECTRFDMMEVLPILNDLQSFDTPVRLSENRAKLILKIIQVRHRLLTELLEDEHSHEMH